MGRKLIIYMESYNDFSPEVRANNKSVWNVHVRCVSVCVRARVCGEDPIGTPEPYLVLQDCMHGNFRDFKFVVALCEASP